MNPLKHTEVQISDLPMEVEFIQAISVDIHGYPKGKMFPREKLEDLLQDQEEIVCMVEVFGTAFEVAHSIKDFEKINFRNNFMVLDKATLRVAPWSKDSSLAMVFYDPYDRVSNAPVEFNPRLIAKNQIKELEKLGLKLFIGVENEFRLFDKATERPVINKLRMFDQFTQSTLFLPYFRQLRKQLKTIDVEFDSCNMEYGESQIEIPLKCYGGIEGIDKIWMFRQVSKYVAEDMGWVANFMTKPLYYGIANGMHINHSLWRETDQGLKNAMWDPSGHDELSEIGKYWLAGLMKHSRALCAIFLPTINCYRRVKAAAWAPTKISWNYRDRSVSMRVKASKDRENYNYIENRLPGSACNIYLAVAGMIAAGLDGIRNKLELIEPGNGSHCDEVPQSLSEALDALKDDTLLVESLGETFVEWFINVKQETEVEKMKDVDIDNCTEEGIAKELDKYCYL